ncbi:glycosyltransferase [Providencia stuartii]|uniref:glycosyltransferase family 2 protein n=1 Tax=Providencia stuartii TaxID=588 RepID=UPI002DB6ED15|nr:glycosyltransferase [Providencia stuartii]WRV51447.1 glycosyltransferase [Providencia stuartii]
MFPIQYYYCEKNLGPAGARNIGANLAKYEWILFLDDDDNFTNDKLEIIFNEINYSNYNFIYNKSIIFMVNEKCSYETSQRDISNIENPIEMIKKFNFIGGTPNFSIKKSLFLSSGGFNIKLRAIEDYEFLIRLIKQNNIKIGFINKPLTNCFYVTKYSSVSKNIQNIIDAGHWIMRNHNDIDINKFKSNLNLMLAHAQLMSLSRKSSIYYLLSILHGDNKMKSLLQSFISLLSPSFLIKLRCLKFKK